MEEEDPIAEEEQAENREEPEGAGKIEVKESEPESAETPEADEPTD